LHFVNVYFVVEPYNKIMSLPIYSIVEHYTQKIKHNKWYHVKINEKNKKYRNKKVLINKKNIVYIKNL
jgi:hypothetical protein